VELMPKANMQCIGLARKLHYVSSLCSLEIPYVLTVSGTVVMKEYIIYLGNKFMVLVTGV